MVLSTNLLITLVVLAGAIGLAVFANWKAVQPWDDLRPRKIPWRPVLIFSGFVAVLAFVHLINIAGIETGRR